MAQINSGLGHETEKDPQPGDLAIFCPACPQPDINLPQEWESDSKRYQLCVFFITIMLTNFRWLYTRSIVIDGNFAAEHLKMKRPEEDIALSPGGRYMVEPKRYELHLRTGKEVKQVSICRKQWYHRLNIIFDRNHFALTTRRSTMLTPLKHTSHLQELVQLHVRAMGVFSPIVLWIFRRERGK